MVGAYWRVGGLANKYGRDVHSPDSHSLVFTCSYFFHATSVLFFKKLVTFTLLIAF